MPYPPLYEPLIGREAFLPVPPPKMSRPIQLPALEMRSHPLASTIVGGSALTPHTLRAAIVLNATRIVSIVRAWFPEPSARITRDDWLDVLSALALGDHSDDGGVAGTFFESQLDAGGDGYISMRDLLGFLVGARAAKRLLNPGADSQPRRRRLPPPSVATELPGGYMLAPPMEGIRFGGVSSESAAIYGHGASRHFVSVTSSISESPSLGPSDAFGGGEFRYPRGASHATLGASVSAPVLTGGDGGGRHALAGRGGGGRHAAKGRGRAVPAAIPTVDEPTGATTAAAPGSARPAAGEARPAAAASSEASSGGRVPVGLPAIPRPGGNTMAMAGGAAAGSAGSLAKAMAGGAAASHNAADVTATAPTPMPSSVMGLFGGGRAKSSAAPSPAGALLQMLKEGPPPPPPPPPPKPVKAVKLSTFGTPVVVPRAVRRNLGDLITAKELFEPEPEPEVVVDAPQIDGKALWQKGFRKGKLMGAFADLTPVKKVQVATEAERTKAIEQAADRVDEITRVLSDWDAGASSPHISTLPRPSLTFSF